MTSLHKANQLCPNVHLLAEHWQRWIWSQRESEKDHRPEASEIKISHTPTVSFRNFPGSNNIISKSTNFCNLERLWRRRKAPEASESQRLGLCLAALLKFPFKDQYIYIYNLGNRNKTKKSFINATSSSSNANRTGHALFITLRKICWGPELINNSSRLGFLKLVRPNLKQKSKTDFLSTNFKLVKLVFKTQWMLSALA